MDTLLKKVTRNPSFHRMSNMRYNHVIFDIDGTIVDNDFSILQSLQDTLHELTGIIHSHEELHMALGVPEYAPLKYYNLPDMGEASKRWTANKAIYAHRVKPFPDVVQLLKELKQAGASLGIVTSRRRAEYISDFFPYGLHPLFETVICSDDTLRHKPEPDPLLAYLEQSKTAKIDAIFIGDSHYDMECASAACVDCGHALWGEGRTKHSKATYHFGTAAELRDLLFS